MRIYEKSEVPRLKRRGLDAVAISRLAGALEVASYSTGPVSRFVATNVLDLVKFYQSRNK